ncbi:MEDS domain-containing protein [Dietzia cinnamea]|uniref:MEDS domain-containing protein n=1 Tax=Dietzia cinnamea TaxID=321318 RepID=UPI00223BA31A|nr:MEDS domain-containing protein [Dietzia cinnamea]MCT2173074.1 MEDS domain-containing protein [Dietzia cinnamea]
MNGLSLGIPGVGAVSSGTHFCALYSGPVERDRLLYPFLEEGLRHGDKCLCLIDDVEPALVRDRAVGQPGADYSRRSAQLDVERASDAYLRSGEFSVEGMVSFLSGCVDKASADNFDLIRAVGEMSWVLPGVPGWDDLFVYESSLNRMVEEMPAILICLYDLQKFGARMLVQVLQTHPKVLLDGTVIDNPHYLRPVEYPAARLTEASRYPMVSAGSHGDEDLDRGWGSLTDGELRVVAGVAAGMTNRAIATKLRLSRHTVDAHLKHVYLKLDIHTRVELTVLALQHHLPMG